MFDGWPIPVRIRAQIQNEERDRSMGTLQERMDAGAAAMKITPNSATLDRGYHCCNCGSHQKEFDEIQHSQHCVAIRLEQQWTVCRFCEQAVLEQPNRIEKGTEQLNALAAECFAIADANGWHDTPREFGTVLMLVVTEVAEAMEAWREGDDDTVTTLETIADGKPEGVPSELADILIRVLHICAIYGIDIRAAMNRKMIHNAGRSYRHGNKLA